MAVIRDAGAQDTPAVRVLFRQYADWLNVDLCFQGFEDELAGLPGAYAPPEGALMVAEERGALVGCVALRRFADGIGEVKRLYVVAECCGRGSGRRLMESLIERARQLGHDRLYLDTVPKMAQAQRLYEALGFRAIPPYYDNPIPGARYLELVLR